MKQNLILYTLIFFIGISCTKDLESDESTLAVVGNKSISEADIAALIDSRLSYKDSLDLVKKLINDWVLEQLLIEKAEANLSDSEMDFTKELQAYRNSLIIHKYKQKFIRQKLKTKISDVEIIDYYNLYSSQYKLKETILKGKIIKVNTKQPDYFKMRKYMNSKDSKLQEQFEQFVEDHFEHWEFTEYTTLVDFLRYCPSIRLKRVTKGGYKRYADVWTKDGPYLVKIDELSRVNSKAPLDWVKEEIKEKLIERKKKALFMDLNTKLVQRAEKIGHVKIK